MIIRICRKEASERLNNNNTVQAERSAVTDSQHLGCVSERRDLAYVPIADNHISVFLSASCPHPCLVVVRFAFASDMTNLPATNTNQSQNPNDQLGFN